ncbi:MAG: DUF3829 domain-containing protein [Bordetella sp.]|nr:DUF3829 domain-containing protein [Pseudomonadota bacterium]
MTSTSSTRTRVAMASLILLGLAACGKTDDKAAAPPAAPPAASAAAAAGAAGQPGGAPSAAANADSASQQWDKKAQAYIQINNRLLKFNGSVNETFAQWAAQARAKVAKGDFKAIRTDTHYFDDSFVKNMKSALDNPASMPAADAAARNLLDTTQKYVPNWKSLEEYNKAKKYEDDNGAEGKRMLPMYIEGVERINDALKQFSAAVDDVARESNAKALAAYKASGKLLELYKAEALNAARAVADTFSSARDFKDAAKIEKANAQLAVMEAKLVDMRAEHEKRKAESPKSLPMIDRYDSVYSSLTAFAGSYREARKNPQKFNDAIGRFNDAIDASNMMSR